jgi:hypothetical protein
MSFARNSLILAAATALGAIAVSKPVTAQTVPMDPAVGNCQVSAAQFASMFVSGNVTLEGVVKPADSTVQPMSNCAFFMWTEQMYLWLLSPAPRSYGGGGRILLSPAFYTVSPVGSDGRRTFLRNQVGRPFNMFLRTTELGPHELPALLSRSGQVVEVASVRRNPRLPLIRLESGRTAQLGTVRRVEGGRLQFLDQGGKPLAVRKLAPPPVRRQMVQMLDGRRLALVPRSAIQNAVRAQKLIFGGIPVFLDSAGNVIDVEPGQADGGVLISQNGSLIFYITFANQMFAFHRTMQGPAVIPQNTNISFPLTAADGAAVQAFASAHGTTIIDPQALALEVKSSWVESASIPNPNDYIQVDATIPTFNKSNPELWIPNGQKTVKMAMVGIHIVGSAKGNGELIWGTMEHFGNSPNGAYSYSSTTGNKNIGQNTSGTWLFTPNGAAGPFNGMKASWDTTTGNLVTTTPGSPIAPTTVLRLMAWGMPGNSLAMNTNVISANSTVISQLLAGDIRRNYFQVGSTWTSDGQGGTGGNEVGTNQLSNTTMETFVQPFNCFGCHNTNKVVVSHVYPKLKPLF